MDKVARREAAVRSKVKNVVSADCHGLRIIQEGDYDVVSSSCCLESSCSERETFKRNLEKLSALVKPGGRIVLFLTERKMESEGEYYFIGSQKHDIVSVHAVYVADLLRSIGYTDALVQVICHSCTHFRMKTFWDSYMFVCGQKGDVLVVFVINCAPTCSPERRGHCHIIMINLVQS